jgi:hypothetical protein
MKVAILTEQCDQCRDEIVALRKIKEAAEVLYSESEECDLPDGLGMSAAQEYWDNLANALFPDDLANVFDDDRRVV